PPPNASPESLSRTRRRDAGASLVTVKSSSRAWTGSVSTLPQIATTSLDARPGGCEKARPRLCGTGPSGCTASDLRADLEAREAGDRDPRVVGDLLDRQLVVLRVGLVEQDDLLEERVHAALDDLRQSCLGLALVAGDLGDDLALLLDDVGRHLVAREVLRRGERDVLRDRASRLGVVTRVGDDDADLRGQVLARLVQVDLERVAR